MDPLAADPAALDAVVARRGLPVAILLTRAGHFRSSQEAADRYDAAVYGHARARARLERGVYTTIEPRDVLPGGARVLEYSPHYDGTPLYLPSHAAVAPGDIVISQEGVLRLWWASENEEDERQYRDEFVASIRRWLELPIEHVLVAHGDYVPGGAAELERALERPPWDVT